MTRGENSGGRRGCSARRGRRFCPCRDISGLNAQANKPAPLETKGEAAQSPWKRYSGWPTRDESKYNTLAKLSSPPAPKQPRKLTAPLAGDAANGAKLVADRNRGGSCLACHVMGQAGNADLPGNVGPDLSEIGNAGREDEWLFNYVYDPRVYNAETVMPPWGSHDLFNDQEIIDMVAFLKTLKAPAKFRTELDNPDKRPAPVEKRENLDPIENPGMWAVDKAKELVKQERGRRSSLPELPRSRRRLSRDFGRLPCRNGSRGSTRCSASKNSSPATPRQRPAPAG